MATATGAYATTAAVKARLFDAGVTDTADDTLIGTICDQVNQFIESPQGTGRILAPVGSATYLIDGNGWDHFYFPRGIRAISALAVGSATGSSRTTLSATDYFLRPPDWDRAPGWPAMWVWLNDRASQRFFPFGYDIVSMTATTGWAAIPDDITDAALTTAVRAWHARQSGQADIVGNDATGAPLVSRYISAYHWATLKAYRVVVPPG